jgi:hypothetical protein
MALAGAWLMIEPVFIAAGHGCGLTMNSEETRTPRNTCCDPACAGARTLGAPARSCRACDALPRDLGRSAACAWSRLGHDGCLI